VGSLLSSDLVRRDGIRGGLVWSAWLNLAGVGLMSFAPAWIFLALGR